MDLIIASSKLFWSKIDGEYGDVLYRSDVRWLRREKYWNFFLALRLATEMFMNHVGKVVGELSEEKCIWNCYAISVTTYMT
jgi:hypothetical protein